MKQVVDVGLPPLNQPFSWAVKATGAMLFTAHGPVRPDGSIDTGPVEQRDAAFLRYNTDRVTKITLPGPFTLTQQAQNDFYADEEELAMDYAVAVNQELRAGDDDLISVFQPVFYGVIVANGIS